jgi:uncharacterized protein YabE (DUF348 family)
VASFFDKMIIEHRASAIFHRCLNIMKINFKLLLAGMFLPVSFASVVSFRDVTPVAVNEPVVMTRPYQVVVYDAFGKKEKELNSVSSKTNPLSIATELGANPNISDRFKAFPDIDMGLGSQISMYRTPEIIIKDGKKTIPVRSWTDTVGDLMAEQRIELLADDKISPSLETTLTPNMEIKITRVAITFADKKQTIAFQTVKKDDDTLDKGKTRIAQAGISGEKILTYEVRREDGTEVSRKLVKTTTSKEPTTEIIMIGTKPVITGWCKYNNLVLDASIKNGLDPDRLCMLMRRESNGNYDSISGGGHLGLFQYTEGFWADASAKAGYAGASWTDPKAQIYTTAWAVTHGYAGRWAGTFK